MCYVHFSHNTCLFLPHFVSTVSISIKSVSQRKQSASHSDTLSVHFVILPIIHRDASALTGAVVMHGGSQWDLLLCNCWIHGGAVYVHTHAHTETQNSHNCKHSSPLSQKSPVVHSSDIRPSPFHQWEWLYCLCSAYVIAHIVCELSDVFISECLGCCP